MSKSKAKTKSAAPKQGTAAPARKKRNPNWSKKELDHVKKLKKQGLKHGQIASSINAVFHSGANIRTEDSVDYALQLIKNGKG